VRIFHTLIGGIIVLGDPYLQGASFTANSFYYILSSEIDIPRDSMDDHPYYFAEQKNQVCTSEVNTNEEPH